MNGQHSPEPGHHDPEKRRRLPNAGCFKKGQSGNRRGRPAGSGKRAQNGTASEILLDKTVTVTLGGKTREISAEEAIQQRTFKDALAGSGMATREVVKWIIRRDEWLKKHAPPPPRPQVTRLFSPDPDNVDEALVLLNIAAPNPSRADIGAERAQLLLEPWATQHGLDRGRRGSRLTERERDWVRHCTRDPNTLIFPDEHRLSFRGETDETD